MGRELEDRIHDLAAGQHGIVTRGQLMEAGMSPAAIGRRLESGRLRALHGGVYVMGPTQPDRATEMAAVLAGGPTAVLSHASAVPVWGFREGPVAGPVDVTVPGSGRGRRSGIRFHRVSELADDERAIVDGIPITSVARTLVDVAGMLGSREIELAVAMADRQGLISSDELATLPERYRGRPGIPVLTALIGEQAAFTRSEAERRCLEMLREAGLPRPHANVPMGPYELDLFWPDERVAVEVDGWAYHSSRARFEGDRRKDAWLRARGIEVVRLTWRQITRDPMRTAVSVGEVLALARARRAV
ncbi:MAG TPA: type IV toxin-antitoxin system AbiEi family antitoxin domain-containing protein, partial [Gemmatimonadales bacterium]|nr:type IV toxin-antitoxin system AbiEi family antitoxin domain-containing protein [Gemmatimonadales bacterium]